jgi:hypothetical protein
LVLGFTYGEEDHVYKPSGEEYAMGLEHAQEHNKHFGIIPTNTFEIKKQTKNLLTHINRGDLSANEHPENEK